MNGDIGTDLSINLKMGLCKGKCSRFAGDKFTFLKMVSKASLTVSLYQVWRTWSRVTRTKGTVESASSETRLRGL